MPWGQVLESGASWAGASAALGDLNVYSNGNISYLNFNEQSPYGLEFQCVELAQRWAAIRFGEEPLWPVMYAYQMWAAGPKLPVPFNQLPNGGATAPQFGDLLIFGGTSQDPAGHVAIVSYVNLAAGYLDLVEQNFYSIAANGSMVPAGASQIPIVSNPNGTYAIPTTYGLPVLGWLRSSTAPLGLQGTGGPGGYTVTDLGQVIPYGAAPPVAQTTSWPWNIARGIAVRPNGSSGYVLDGFGGVHAFGGAPQVEVTGYWNGWDIARAIILRPDGQSGYVLDGWGGSSPLWSSR